MSDLRAVRSTNGSADIAGPDGPWRIGDRLTLCTSESAPDDEARGRLTDLAAGLRQIGVACYDTAFLDTALGMNGVLTHEAGRPFDVLLLAPGVSIEPKAVLELRRVAASDPMIAAVSPSLDEKESAASEPFGWRDRLPALSYTPFGDPACLYIKGSVLAQFAPIQRNAPIDWDAYALTVNTGGFRMVRANHALFHGPRAPASEANLAARAMRLEPRFPGTRAALRAYLAGAPYAADRLISGLSADVEGRRIVAFDFTHIGATCSGTAVAAVALVQRAALAWSKDWAVAVVAPASTHAFHFGSILGGPERIDPADPTVCAAFIRIGQPFGWKDLDAAVRRSPTLIFLMLDTIGLDCILLAPDDLDALWRFTLAEADGIVFNSAFTKRQFERRFGLRADQPQCVSLHSLDVADYRNVTPSRDNAGASILIVGNSFPHKNVEATAKTIAAARPELAIVALGLEPGRVAGVTGFPSGGLSETVVDALYGAARLVVYPSLYEGFGLPLMEALAHRKPILVRALAPFDEIIAALPQATNVHRFADDADLMRLIDADLRWIEVEPGSSPRNWNDGVADLRHVLEEAISRVTIERVTRRLDFMAGRVSWARQKRFHSAQGWIGAEPADDTVDKAAAFAGRRAEAIVRRVAGWPLVRRLLGRATGVR